jgi:hypothetical protein
MVTVMAHFAGELKVLTGEFSLSLFVDLLLGIFTVG